MEGGRPLGVLIAADPSLVDVELAAGPAKVESGACRGAVWRCAGVGHGAVEEVRELVASSTARRLVVKGRVGQVEVDVSP